MLVGHMTYMGHTLHLKGYHIADSFAFLAHCESSAERRFYDVGSQDPNEDEPSSPQWDELYVGVGTSNVTVQHDGFRGDKPGVNREAFAYLGDALRGMLRGCTTTRREDFYEIKTEGDFDGLSDIKFVIGGYGSVVKNMGAMRAIDFSDAEGEIKLHDDGEFIQPFFPPTLKVQVGIHPARLVSLSEENTVVSAPAEGMFYSLEEIFAANPHKNYSWIKDQNFTMVTKDTYKDVCREIMAYDGLVMYDTETTGLKMNVTSLTGEGDQIVGMVFSIRKGHAWYVPLRHKAFENIGTEDELQGIMDRYFKPILETKKLCGHNSGFDWRATYTFGINCNFVHDTLVLYKITLWNDNRNLRVGLKPLTKEMTGRDSLELTDFVEGDWGESFGNFAHLPLQSVLYYACPDVDNMWLLLEEAERRKLLELYGARKTYETEVLFGLATAYQEFYGHCADVKNAPAINDELDKNMAEAYAQMVSMAKRDFNPNSAQQLGEIMYKVLDYPVYKQTASGASSTDKKTLERLAGARNTMDEPLYPFADTLLRYRESATIKKGVLGKLDELATSEGLMFSEVQPFLETGRVSVKNPNYQSYNDVVKRSIIPRSDFYTCDYDYSSVEYRILASMAGQQNLVEAFYDPDTDYHMLQASRMYSIPYELVTKEQRSQSKGINFGIPYGMGDPSLGAHIFGSVTKENTQKATILRRKYFEGQDKIEGYFTQAQSDGVKNSWATTYFGRRRYFDRNKVRVDGIRRQAGNHGIQGTAADLYKMGIGRLFLEICKRDLLGLVLISAFVHDEAVLEIHKSLDPMIMMKMVRECAMLQIPGWCPLYIGIGFGESWYEAKSSEIPIQLQDILEEKYGDTGLDWWDGDRKKLTAWIQAEINVFNVERVREYVCNAENTGKVVNPTINSLAHSVMGGIEKGKITEGVVENRVSEKKDTIENLEQFSIAFGVEEEFLKRGFVVPQVVESSIELKAAPQVWEEEPEETPEEKLAKIFQRCKTLGVTYDREDKMVYFSSLGSDTLTGGIVKILQGNEGNIPVSVFMKNASGAVVVSGTSLKANIGAVQKISSLWLAAKG